MQARPFPLLHASRTRLCAFAASLRAPLPLRSAPATRTQKWSAPSSHALDPAAKARFGSSAAKMLASASHAPTSPWSQRPAQVLSPSAHSRASRSFSGSGPRGGGSGTGFIPCFSASAHPPQGGSRFFPSRRRMRNSTRRFMARAASSFPGARGQ